MRIDRRSFAALSAAGALTRPVQAAIAIRTWKDYAPCRFGQILVTSAEPSAILTVGKTPLVCMHLTPRNGGYFREFQAVMATDRLVICPDTPGYGGSDKPTTKPSIEDYAAGIADAMRAMGYGSGGQKGALDWLGWHTGTVIILEIAANHPDLVRRLVAPGIPYFPPDMRPAKRKEFANPRPYFEDPEYIGRLFRDTVLAMGAEGLSRERHFEFFVDRMRSGQESWWGFDAVFLYDMDRALAKITQPVLCPVLTERTTAETRNAIRQMVNAKSTKLVEMPELTPWAWQVEPDKIAAVVRPFLDAA